MQRVHQSSKPIDLEAESSLPEEWASIHVTPNSSVSDPPETIVLTGATGLLCHHLLEHLLKHTTAKAIHCLAVRGLSERLQKGELTIDPRVNYYQANLSEPLLGLSANEANSIFSAADAVLT